MPPAGGSITISTISDLDSVSILISDTGSGIEKDHLHKLGNPFELGENQYGRARPNSGQGSGLGLALSKSLMELQDGLLALSSKPQKGTIACATFPRRAGAIVRLPQMMRQNAHILTRHHHGASSPQPQKSSRRNAKAPQAAE